MNKHGKLSYTVFDIYMRLICLFPIFTVIRNEWIFNKLLFALVIVLHFWLLVKYKVKKQSAYSVALMLLLLIFSTTQTIFPVENINLFFYYPFFVLYTVLFAENIERFRKWFCNSINFVRGIMFLWTAIVGVSAIFPSSYYVKEGGALYFGSFCGDIFRLGPSAFFIQALVLISMSLYKKRRDILFMILPMFSYFMGSSRIYLLIGVCLFIVAWYWYGVSKKVFILTIIPLVAIGAYFTIRSAIMDKILYTLDDSQYGDFWFRFTSSRSVLWNKDLQMYVNQPILNKLFGSGIDITIKTTRLWAHNDFIELICSFGALGLIQYIVLVIRCLFKKIEISPKTVPIVIKVCVIVAWLFNAFFNMHYTYFCCVLSFPFVILATRYYADSHESSIMKTKNIREICV